MRIIANSVWNDGAHAPLSNFQTGMPSILALSARFAEIPEPGNTMTPIGITASIWSLRRNGAALAWRVPAGFEGGLGALRGVAPAAAGRPAPPRAPPRGRAPPGGLAGNPVRPSPLAWGVV